jgi:PP-loop superfamily ATP-utilizing enzyme
MSFENQIQQWVQLDNQLKQLNDKTKELREKRNSLEQNITTYASSNNLSNATVNIGNGKLKFVNTKVQEPLTFKYLEKTLSEVIKNENQVKLIMAQVNLNTDELKKFMNHIVRNNQYLQTNGKIPVAVAVEGEAGIGKTSTILQIGKELGLQDAAVLNLP